MKALHGPIAIGIKGWQLRGIPICGIMRSTSYGLKFLARVILFYHWYASHLCHITSNEYDKQKGKEKIVTYTIPKAYPKVVSNPYLLVFHFIWVLISHMVVLCLKYLLHSFVLTSLIGDVVFHVVGTCTQLVVLPNRRTWYFSASPRVGVWQKCYLSSSS